MKLNRNQRRAAREQLRRFQTEESSEEYSFGRHNRKREISNQDEVDDMKRSQKEARDNRRKQVRQGRRILGEIRRERGPKAKISYCFEPGELVMITEKAAKKINLEYMGLFPGATGVIVEQENTRANWKSEYEEGRYIQVMGPNGLQQWDVRWVTHLEDDDCPDE